MTIARIVPAVALLALLAGCAGGPSAVPTPTQTLPVLPSATPTPTAEPEPEPVATTITVGGASTIFADQDGAVMFEIVYGTPDPATVEKVTELLGIEPTLKEVRRGVATDAFSGTVFSWDGFSVSWFGKWQDEPGSGQRPYASVGAASAGPAAIQTPDGLAVGQAVDLMASFPDSSMTSMFEGTTYARAWVNCIPIGIPDAADCVGVVAQPADGPISSFYAPYELNHGL